MYECVRQGRAALTFTCLLLLLHSFALFHELGVEKRRLLHWAEHNFPARHRRRYMTPPFVHSFQQVVLQRRYTKSVGCLLLRYPKPEMHN